MTGSTVNELTLVRATPYDINPAVPRTLAAARDVFDRASVLCWNHKGLSRPRSEVLDGVLIRRLNFRLGGSRVRALIGMPLYLTWVLVHLLHRRPRVVQAFDFYSMIPAIVARWLTGCQVIYDMRDPLADSFTLFVRFPMLRRLVHGMDWMAMGFATAFVVPDESRVGYLGRWGRLKPVGVIRNTCHDELAAVEGSEEFRSLPPSGGAVRVALLGYVVATRGANELLEAVEGAETGAELWVAGACSPPRLADRFEAAPNATWWGKCPWRKSLALTRAADLVAILYDPVIPVNRIAAPNKLYESLMLGTPVLVSRGMELGEWVEREGLGFVVDYGNVQVIRDVFRRLEDPAERRRIGRRCREYFLRHCTLSAELDTYRRYYRRRLRISETNAKAPRDR